MFGWLRRKKAPKQSIADQVLKAPVRRTPEECEDLEDVRRRADFRSLCDRLGIDWGSEHRGVRRVDLDCADTIIVEAYERSLCAMNNRQPHALIKIPVPIDKAQMFCIPIRPNAPETKLVAWDEVEQLHVLSATCYCGGGQ